MYNFLLIFILLLRSINGNITLLDINKPDPKWDEMIEIYTPSHGQFSFYVPRYINRSNGNSHPLSSLLEPVENRRREGERGLLDDDAIKELHRKEDQATSSIYFKALAQSIGEIHGSDSEKAVMTRERAQEISSSPNPLHRRKLGAWDKLNSILNAMVIKVNLTGMVPNILDFNQSWDLLKEWLKDERQGTKNSFTTWFNQNAVGGKIECTQMNTFRPDLRPVACPMMTWSGDGLRLTTGVYLRDIFMGEAANEHHDESGAKPNYCDSLQIGSLSTSINFPNAPTKDVADFNIKITGLTAVCHLWVS
eukprot:g2102.t1